MNLELPVNLVQTALPAPSVVLVFKVLLDKWANRDPKAGQANRDLQEYLDVQETKDLRDNQELRAIQEHQECRSFILYYIF